MSARLLAVGTLVLAACFDPAPPEGLPCGPPPELACPMGQACAADGTCRVPGQGEADAPRADGAGVDSPPGTPDAASPDAMGGFTVARIEVSDDVAVDQDPSMTIDGRELVWSSTRAGGLGNSDLWHSTRASTSSAWGTPEPLTIVNSIAKEQSPEIGRFGLSLYFVTTRGGTSHDVWVAFRASTSEPWSAPVPVAGLSTMASEHNVTVHGHLTAVVDRELVAGGPRDLFLAERTDPTDPWPVGAPIAELNTGDSEGAPFLSADHLTLYFHRSSVGIQQIHVATRTDPDGVFSTAQPILDNHDSDPWASDDGNTLLFTRAGDLYIATR
jgi:hypothetical protein